MSNLDRFKTRAACNNPLRLPLVDPSTKQQTEHWIEILGVDSDAFQQERMESSRRLVEYQRQLKELQAKLGRDLSPAELQAKADEYNAAEKLQLVASLVVSWSFEDELNRSSVVAFLQEAPLVADYINAAAADRQLFLMPRQNS